MATSESENALVHENPLLCNDNDETNKPDTEKDVLKDNEEDISDTEENVRLVTESKQSDCPVELQPFEADQESSLLEIEQGEATTSFGHDPTSGTNKDLNASCLESKEKCEEISSSKQGEVENQEGGVSKVSDDAGTSGERGGSVGTEYTVRSVRDRNPNNIKIPVTVTIVVITLLVGLGAFLIIYLNVDS